MSIFSKRSTLPLFRFYPRLYKRPAHISAMLITLLLILSTGFAPLALTASPTGLQDTVHCYNKPDFPSASITDCTDLLKSLETIPRFRVKTIYSAGRRMTVEFLSCNFQLLPKDPYSGAIERIKLIQYFPALQQTIEQCLEAEEQYNCGWIDVGQHFWAGIGADRPVGNVTDGTVAKGRNRDL